jgi:hypothetical protein
MVKVNDSKKKKMGEHAGLNVRFSFNNCPLDSSHTAA